MNQQRLLPGWLLLVLPAIAFFIAGCGSGSSSQSGVRNIAVGPDSRYKGAPVDPALEKPDIVLTDTDSKPFDLRAATAGKLTLLYLGYTHCPDICPTHMAVLASAMKRLPEDVRSRIQVVFVTTDPDRDTPSAIRKWLDQFDRSFIGLTGPLASIAKLSDDIGIDPPKKTDLGGGDYAVTHSAFVIAYTADNIAHIVYPSGVERDDWEHDLPTLVKDGWKGQ